MGIKNKCTVVSTKILLLLSIHSAINKLMWVNDNGMEKNEINLNISHMQYNTGIGINYTIFLLKHNVDYNTPEKKD